MCIYASVAFYYKSNSFSSSSCLLNFKWNLYDTLVCAATDIEAVTDSVKSKCCDTVLCSVELSVIASEQDLSSSVLSLADLPVVKMFIISCVNDTYLEWEALPASCHLALLSAFVLYSQMAPVSSV